MCIYISQAKPFSGLFTHNVLGAAKMPVVFYLDFVAMHISPKSTHEQSANETQTLHIWKHPQTNTTQGSKATIKSQ